MPELLGSVPVIFLDVDGVLNSQRCVCDDYEEGDRTLLFASDVLKTNEYMIPLERHMLENLKYILNEVPSAQICVSSTWREEEQMKSFLYAALKSIGIDTTTKIIGATPSLGPLDGRGAEILQWLQENAAKVSPNWIIIDDDHEYSFQKHNLTDHWIRTLLKDAKEYSDEGLTKEKADEAIQLLLRHSDLTEIQSSEFSIDYATKDDCEFIAKATIYAERALLGVGMWDVFFEGHEEYSISKCLTLCSSTVENSHLNWRNFIIARYNGVPVASCSRYMKPFSVIATYDGLKDITTTLLNWEDKEYDAACDRLDFLRDESSWPDLPIYEGTCFIETVFTEILHRKKGIASMLMRRCISDGENMGAARCFLLAAIGNDKAIRIYNNVGLTKVAQLIHPKCQRLLKLPGFEIMTREFTKVEE
jgi:hypothetical protein